MYKRIGIVIHLGGGVVEVEGASRFGNITAVSKLIFLHLVFVAACFLSVLEASSSELLEDSFAIFCSLFKCHTRCESLCKVQSLILKLQV